LAVTITSGSVDVQTMDQIKPWMHDSIASILAAMILKKRFEGFKRYDSANWTRRPNEKSPSTSMRRSFL